MTEEKEISIEEGVEIAWDIAIELLAEAFIKSTEGKVSPALAMAMIERLAAIHYTSYKEASFVQTEADERSRKLITAWYDSIRMQTEIKALNSLRDSYPTESLEVVWAGQQSILNNIYGTDLEGELHVQSVDIH